MMLKWVRVNRLRGQALLVLGLTDENLQRLPGAPIGFHPGEPNGLGRMRIQHEGTWYNLSDVLIVHGTDERALGEWLKSHGVNAGAVDQARDHMGVPVVAHPGAPERKH